MADELIIEAGRRWGKWVAVDAKPLARSAMSHVWRVRDETAGDGGLRALKEMKYSKGRGSAGYRRFVREITTLTTGLAGSPGIVEVLDYALPVEGEEGAPFYVMPLASSTLERMAKPLRGRLEHVIEIGLAVAEALRVAHAAGVVHRDVKPANVLLFGDEQTPVLCDFGICFLEEEEGRLTRAEAHTVGTDDFVAPELRGGGASERVTPAADVYSLGKTLYAAVSGGTVFPREWIDDARFDLAVRFEDERLAHLRGLLEVMVTEAPAGRLQTMGEVKEVLARAVANLRAGVPYQPGMYGGAHSPAERTARLRRVLGQPESLARGDLARQAVDDAVAAARARATEFLGRARLSLRQDGQVTPEAADAASASAEELLSAGLPLVEANVRDEFDEWLALAIAPASRRGDRSDRAGELILAPAGVAAAHGVGALAWRLRRLDLLRHVVDQYEAAGSRWLHHDVLGRNATNLIPWVTKTLAASESLRRVNAPPAADVERAVNFLSGLAVLRFVAKVPQETVQAFLTPYGQRPDFPLPFAPGLLNASWATELAEVGLTRPPVEREIARALFDKSVPEFRAMCRDLTPALIAFVNYAVNRVDHGRKEWIFMVDVQRWSEWCGAAL